MPPRARKGLPLFTKALKCQVKSDRLKKLADKPGFVMYCYTDSHSSRRTITHALKQPTHWQREQRLIPAYLVLLQMEVTAFHPFRRKLAKKRARRSNRLVSVALFLASRRTAVSRHLALCSPDFPPSRK
jgi:hypothetical protein